ncbi:TetR family transcriptional regulator [Variovorax sp. AFSI2.2]|uniref:TetR family transcriptional regulator n=1 Tax=Variovorax sp. AFSI2.2 TaxID=3384160 RepID=UPI003EBC63A3
MRRNRAATEITRTRVLQAALEAFAASGVRATTLENVARLAGVTRGAVYWHFENKAALVAAIIDQLRWPMDIGPDMVAYQAHPEPLQLLREQMWRQMTRCMEDPDQWRAAQLVLRHPAQGELPVGVVTRIGRTMGDTVARLSRVMTLACERRQLKEGLRPACVARCLHSVGIAVLAEHANQREKRRRRASLLLCIDLFMAGACSDAPAIQS